MKLRMCCQHGGGKKYDGETLDQMTSLDARNEAYDDFTPEAREDAGDRYDTPRRFFPRCTAWENIRCEVHVNLRPSKHKWKEFLSRNIFLYIHCNIWWYCRFLKSWMYILQKKRVRLAKDQHFENLDLHSAKSWTDSSTLEFTFGLSEECPSAV